MVTTAKAGTTDPMQAAKALAARVVAPLADAMGIPDFHGEVSMRVVIANGRVQVVRITKEQSVKP